MFNQIKQKINQLNKDEYCYRFSFWTTSNFEFQYLYFDSLYDFILDVQQKAVDDIDKDETVMATWEQVLDEHYSELGFINYISPKACNWLMETDEFTFFKKQDFILKFNQNP